MCITPSVPKYNSNSIQPLSQLLEAGYMNPFSPFSSIQKQGHYTSYRTHILLYYGCPRKFGLPLLVDIDIITLLNIALSALYCMCPNHYKRFSHVLSPIDATFTVSRICSFWILSIVVLPYIHLYILILATFILLTCCFLVAQHSVP